LAQNGYNLIFGIANWRSGDYILLNEADLRRTIELCHMCGIKIIPYISLVDLSHATQAWRDHGEEWAIEPTTEYASRAGVRADLRVEMSYRNDSEQETTLMCPGAEGGARSGNSRSAASLHPLLSYPAQTCFLPVRRSSFRSLACPMFCTS
jgi:hypothetical protein